MSKETSIVVNSLNDQKSRVAKNVAAGTVKILNDVKNTIQKHVVKHKNVIIIVIILFIICIGQAIFIFIMWKKYAPKMQSFASHSLLNTDESITLIRNPVSFVFTCRMDLILNSDPQNTHDYFMFTGDGILKCFQKANLNVPANMGDPGSSYNNYYQIFVIHVEDKEGAMLTHLEYNMPTAAGNKTIKICVIMDPSGKIIVQFNLGSPIKPAESITLSHKFNTLSALKPLQNVFLFDHVLSQAIVDKFLA